MKAAADALLTGARYLQTAALEERPLNALEIVRSTLACEAALATLQAVSRNCAAG